MMLYNPLMLLVIIQLYIACKKIHLNFTKNMGEMIMYWNPISWVYDYVIESVCASND